MQALERSDFSLKVAKYLRRLSSGTVDQFKPGLHESQLQVGRRVMLVSFVVVKRRSCSTDLFVVNS